MLLCLGLNLAFRLQVFFVFCLGSCKAGAAQLLKALNYSLRCGPAHTVFGESFGKTRLYSPDPSGLGSLQSIWNLFHPMSSNHIHLFHHVKSRDRHWDGDGGHSTAFSCMDGGDEGFTRHTAVTASQTNISARQLGDK